MKDVIATTVVSIPIVNEITDDGILTALELENMVLLGLTYGAWFKVGMMVALILLILERSMTVRKGSKSR